MAQDIGSNLTPDPQMERYRRTAGIVACCVAILAGLYFVCLYLLAGR